MSTIKSSTTSTTAYSVVADTTGTLVFQTGATPTTAVTISSAQVATFAQAPVLPSASIPQAALAANVAGNGPAFSYYQSSGQTLTTAVNTKITFTGLDFDTTSGMYATGTSRFTPTVAGYYQINAGIFFNLGVLTLNGTLSIFKNGSTFRVVNGFGSNTNGWFNPVLSSIVYLNGSTDYVEIYATQSSGTNQNTATSAGTFFQAAMVRGA